MKCGLFPIVGVLLALCGCAKLVSADKSPAGEQLEFATFDPTLLGPWYFEVVDDDASIIREYALIERAGPDSKSYLVTEWETRKVKGRETTLRGDDVYEFHLLKAGGKLFSVLTIGPEMFLILRTERLDDEYHYSMMKAEFFARREPEAGFPFEEHKGDITLKGDAKSLRDFLAEHADDPTLWSESEMLCSRTEPPRRITPEKKAVARKRKAKKSR